MSTRINGFRNLVEQHTGGNPKKALPLSDYLTLLGYTYPARRASVRAQITRDLKVSGQLRDLVDKGLVLADQANRQPECFEGIERRPSTMPVVFEKGPVADLQSYPVADLTVEAREAQQALSELVATKNLPVKAADAIAHHTNKLLFEVERQTLRADAAEQREKIHREHLQEMRDMYRLLAPQLQREQSVREEAD